MAKKKLAGNVGQIGELLAVKYLESQGFVILERNFRYKRAEIDIIARQEHLVIFVEVKARSSHKFGTPEDFVDAKKSALVMEAAEQYVIDKNWKHDIRFDIISITFGKSNEIEHFEDAFH